MNIPPESPQALLKAAESVLEILRGEQGHAEAIAFWEQVRADCEKRVTQAG